MFNELEEAGIDYKNAGGLPQDRLEKLYLGVISHVGAE